MAFARVDRISEEVRKGLDKIIREELRDARVGGTYSITRAEVTRDLRWAKVRVSVLEEDRRKPMLDALKNAAGFLRRRLGQDMRLRYTPELLFELDTNIAYGAHIADVLKRIIPQEQRDSSEPAAEADGDADILQNDERASADVSDSDYDE